VKPPVKAGGNKQKTQKYGHGDLRKKANLTRSDDGPKKYGDLLLGQKLASRKGKVMDPTNRISNRWVYHQVLVKKLKGKCHHRGDTGGS